ncbi:cytochrome b [Lysobacter silvisoli]|uniref:Cytochrome b n=1 Tax=Lysobacter silvisoli TaxID=2293254 RepID=A0A371K682_9GAMM|nr:cytochrome b [Lysobacter silvisoli]
MTIKNTAERWGAVSQLLHWAIVLLIAAIAVIGLTMTDMANGPQKIKIYALHKSLGLTLLTLVVLRLLWRLYAGAPKAVAGTPHWQERVASLTHWALYLLMFAMPITGWLFNSSSGYPLQYFGLFNLPKIAATNPGLAELSESLHENGFWLLLALVLAHAGAAFYHHLFQNDDTLRRMLPGYRRAAPAAAAEPAPAVVAPAPAPENPDAP